LQASLAVTHQQQFTIENEEIFLHGKGHRPVIAATSWQILLKISARS